MPKTIAIIESLTRAIGSVWSILFHTLAFIIAFGLGIFKLAAWDSILLMLTTIVSLEAIYLAIFIQIAVNQNTESLREVEVDVDEIQKDIDAIESDEAKEELRDLEHKEAIEKMSEHLKMLLKDIEKLKR